MCLDRRRPASRLNTGFFYEKSDFDRCVAADFIAKMAPEDVLANVIPCRQGAHYRSAVQLIKRETPDGFCSARYATCPKYKSAVHIVVGGYYHEALKEDQHLDVRMEETTSQHSISETSVSQDKEMSYQNPIIRLKSRARTPFALRAGSGTNLGGRRNSSDHDIASNSSDELSPDTDSFVGEESPPGTDSFVGGMICADGDVQKVTTDWKTGGKSATKGLLRGQTYFLYEGMVKHKVFHKEKRPEALRVARNKNGEEESDIPADTIGSVIGNFLGHLH